MATNNTNNAVNTHGHKTLSTISKLVKQFRNVPLRGLMVGVMEEAYDKNGKKLTSVWISKKVGMSIKNVRRIALEELSSN